MRSAAVPQRLATLAWMAARVAARVSACVALGGCAVPAAHQTEQVHEDLSDRAAALQSRLREPV
ncbi:MAG TPA: hypothetical protein VF536_13935, partial [Roseateles sp.]